MFRVRDEVFSDARRRAIGSGLVAGFAGSPLRAGRDPATGDVVVDDPKGRRTRVSFDRQGFVGGVTSPLGRRWGLESDPSGRPTAMTDPAGLRLAMGYDAGGRLSRVGRGARPLCELDYDDQGRVARYRFPDGTSTRLDRGPTGEVSALTDRTGTAIAFEQDEDGTPTALADGRGHRTHFDYGPDGWLARIRRPDGSADAYERDPSGLLRAITAADGSRLSIDRDAAGRVVAVDAGDGDVSTFAYDSAGRVTEAVNASAAVRFAYDSEGRLVSESTGDGVVRYEYDEAGTLVALVGPAGERVGFDRDDDLRLVRVTDWAGGVHRIDYDSDDRGMTIRTPNGLIASVELTEAGQVAETAVREPLRVDVRGAPGRASPLFSASYRYDAEDRLVSAVDSEHGERRYRYDAENRLVAADRPGRGVGETFSYDGAGNRVRAGAASATYNPADGLIAQGTTRCALDERGNLVTQSSPRETWHYTYDGRDRLIRAESRSGRVVTFGYDAFGRRVWKRSDGATTRFVWAGETLIREARPDGSTRDTLYAPGTPTPLAIRDGGAVYCVHVDHLGTPRRLTDPRGAVAWSADLDAFGSATITRADVANSLRFPGHSFDEETGLHYNRFRYYAPDLGRYLTRDPASYLGGLNLYAYAGNDPINASDPLGLWPSWKTVVSVVAAVAVGVAVVALAPAALGVGAILLAGAAAGAVGMGLNEALNQEKFCLGCIAEEALKGALVGALASVPFVFLPATAGVAAFMGAGALSGGIGYIAGTPPSQWSLGGLATSVAIGAGTAGAGRHLGGRYSQWRQNRAPVSEPPPPAQSRAVPREEGVPAQRSSTGAKRGPKTDANAPHNAKIRAEAERLRADGNEIVAGGGGKEQLIRTPGGVKGGRRPDILYRSPNGQLRGRNVGKTKADGSPVPREVDALDDLNGPGNLPTDFVPYDR